MSACVLLSASVGDDKAGLAACEGSALCSAEISIGIEHLLVRPLHDDVMVLGELRSPDIAVGHVCVSDCRSCSKFSYCSSRQGVGCEDVRRRSVGCMKG